MATVRKYVPGRTHWIHTRQPPTTATLNPSVLSWPGYSLLCIIHRNLRLQFMTTKPKNNFSVFLFIVFIKVFHRKTQILAFLDAATPRFFLEYFMLLGKSCANPEGFHLFFYLFSSPQSSLESDLLSFSRWLVLMTTIPPASLFHGPAQIPGSAAGLSLSERGPCLLFLDSLSSMGSAPLFATVSFKLAQSISSKT